MKQYTHSFHSLESCEGVCAGSPNKRENTMANSVDIIRAIRDLVKVASADPRGAQIVSTVTRLVLAIAVLMTLPSLLAIVFMLVK